MNTLKKNYDNQVKRKLFLKFFYNNLTDIPRIKAIELEYYLSKPNEKQLTSAVLALEISSLKPIIYQTKTSLDIFVKVQKGCPVCCKIVLSNKWSHFFLKRIIKNFCFSFKFSNYYQKLLSLSLSTILVDKKIKMNYLFFRQLPDLNIKIYTNCKSLKKLKFLTKQYKLFI
jgi:hypothetical protein